jgi:hypothetical protein
MPEITRAKSLHQGQFTRLIKITQATSRYPERDVLVLMLGHHCGMRITEISRIKGGSSHSGLYASDLNVIKVNKWSVLRA